MTTTVKQTILATLVGVLILGSMAFVAPFGANAAYDDLPAFVKNQIGEMHDHVTARRDAYAQYRDAYLANRATFQNERGKAKQAGKDVRSCKGDPSPPCDRVRNAFADSQKAVMAGATTRIENHLGDVEQYLVAHINNEDEKTVVLDWINEIRANLSGVAGDIENISTASSREDALAIRATVNEAFRDVRAVSGAIRAHYLLSTAVKTHEKFDSLLVRFNAEKDELATIGTDTTKLAELITTYETQVADVQQHIDAASALYSDLVGVSIDEDRLETAARNFDARSASAKAHYRSLLAAAKEVFKELHSLSNQ